MTVDSRNLNARIVYNTLEHNDVARLCTFAYTAHHTSQDYGMKILIIGLCVTNSKNWRQLPYISAWSFQEQNRICHSSYGAGILAAEVAEDRGDFFKIALDTLFLNADINHVLNVDWKAHQVTITTLHGGREYRLRQAVQKLCCYLQFKGNKIKW